MTLPATGTSVRLSAPTFVVALCPRHSTGAMRGGGSRRSGGKGLRFAKPSVGASKTFPTFRAGRRQELPHRRFSTRLLAVALAGGLQRGQRESPRLDGLRRPQQPCAVRELFL